MSNSEILRMIEKAFESLRSNSVNIEFRLVTNETIKSKIYNGRIKGSIQTHGDFCLEINSNEDYYTGWGHANRKVVWDVDPHSIIAIKIY